MVASSQKELSSLLEGQPADANRFRVDIDGGRSGYCGLASTPERVPPPVP